MEFITIGLALGMIASLIIAWMALRKADSQEERIDKQRKDILGTREETVKVVGDMLDQSERTEEERRGAHLSQIEQEKAAIWGSVEEHFKSFDGSISALNSRQEVHEQTMERFHDRFVTLEGGWTLFYPLYIGIKDMHEAGVSKRRICAKTGLTKHRVTQAITQIEKEKAEKEAADAVLKEVAKDNSTSGEDTSV